MQIVFSVEAICMKYQSLFSGENKEKICKMSSAAFFFTQHATR